MYIKYLSLPNTIPSDVMESLDAIKAKPFATGTAFDGLTRLRVKNVSPALTEYLETLFPFPIICRYHFMNFGFPIRQHGDGKCTIDYVLQAGGENVVTNVYNIPNPNKIIESASIEPFKWHSVHTPGFYHTDFVDHDSVRISLVINGVDQVTASEISTFIEANSL